jgi:hypothetical protein
VWRDFPIVVAVVGVCASIASFIALMEISSPGWGLIALEHGSVVLIAGDWPGPVFTNDA